MTETSPMCCLSVPPRDATAEDEPLWRAKSGRPVPGMEVRLVDDAGEPAATTACASANLQLRGPWVTGRYHRDASPDSFTADGWLRTGDVGTIDAHGYVQITDRSKDVIKSGGEWVSSVDLENQLAAHPGRARGRRHRRARSALGRAPARADRRARPDEPSTRSALHSFLRDRVARFWVPEYWAFVTDAAEDQRRQDRQERAASPARRRRVSTSGRSQK